jgi:hypothetical protein
MAMTDEMDDLLMLYRQASHEAPSPLMDTRILRAADQASVFRRWYRHAAWPAALAAAVLLWAVWQGHAVPVADTAAPMVGYDAGASRAELLQMDVTPPHDELDRFLLNVSSTHSPSTTRNAP